MKFFIDTANLEEIREAHRLGLVAGGTTLPLGKGVACGPGRWPLPPPCGRTG